MGEKFQLSDEARQKITKANIADQFAFNLITDPDSQYALMGVGKPTSNRVILNSANNAIAADEMLQTEKQYEQQLRSLGLPVETQTQAGGFLSVPKKEGGISVVNAQINDGHNTGNAYGPVILVKAENLKEFLEKTGVKPPGIEALPKEYQPAGPKQASDQQILNGFNKQQQTGASL